MPRLFNKKLISVKWTNESKDKLETEDNKGYYRSYSDSTKYDKHVKSVFFFSIC